jgi:hypothetical protein
MFFLLKLVKQFLLFLDLNHLILPFNYRLHILDFLLYNQEVLAILILSNIHHQIKPQNFGYFIYPLKSLPQNSMQKRIGLFKSSSLKEILQLVFWKIL